MNKNGQVNLIEVLIGMALTSLVIMAVITGFKIMQRGQSQSVGDNQTLREIQDIAIFLKMNLEGAKGIQSVGFQIPPGGPSSFGTGFLVVPNKDFNNNALANNDLIYILVAVPISTTIQLAYCSPIDGVGCTATASCPVLGQVCPTITAAKPADKLSDFIKVGDLVAFSNVHASEVLKVTAAPLPNQTDTLDLSGVTTWDYTYIPTGGTANTLSQTYVAGDYVFKAKLIQVGLDAASQQIRSKTVGAAAFTTVGRNVSAFKVNYNLTAPDASNDVCSAVTTPPDASGNDTFSRASWAAINTGTGNLLNLNCYTRVHALAVDYSVGAVGTAGLKTSRYIFKTTN